MSTPDYEARIDYEYDRTRDDACCILRERGLDPNKVKAAYLLIIDADARGDDAFFERLGRSSD